MILYDKDVVMTVDTSEGVLFFQKYRVKLSPPLLVHCRYKLTVSAVYRIFRTNGSKGAT